jgi:hypothetical protein
MRLALAAALCTLAASAGAAEFVWWEGESATSTNFDNTSFKASQYGDKAEGLSGGDWLNTGGKRQGEAKRATWTVQVPSAGSWHFLTRKFWKHGPFRWRFDGGEWKECGRDCGLIDSYELAKFICANWVALGDVTLAAGAHALEIELLAKEGEDAGACFDCFVLSKEPFVARGKLRPGEAYGLAEPGWWSFEPAADTFAPTALLDLRPLNEKRAGEHGFLQAKGDGFADGAGKPISFYAVNTGMPELDDAQLDYFAARLAKVGVNMVRIHGLPADRGGSDPFAINPRRLDRLHYLQAALAKQGIYTYLSSFFPLWMEIKPSDGIPGYENLANKHPFGLDFFDPRFQELHRAWLKQVLTAKNPYSGSTLATDPALGMVEIINEDSLFFWTFSEKNVGATQWAALEARFAAWLAKRYGSLAKARESWQGDAHAHDGADRAGLADPWAMTAEGLAKASPGRAARIRDQVRFYGEVQRGWYADTTAWLRAECGVKCPVSGSNWTTADNRTLGLIERWTYTGAGIIDHHGYFGGKHDGDGAGWSIRAGHTFTDRCALLEPAELPIKSLQIAGAPNILTEIAWLKPNRYIADNQPVISSYAALQGLDAVFTFAIPGGNWASDGAGVFTLPMPGELGQFPAAALQFRRGDLTPGETVVRQVVAGDGLWALDGKGLGEGTNADSRTTGAVQHNESAYDPLAFYAGRVETSFAADAKPVAMDLAKAIDHGAKTITSTTGQLRWDWGQGVLRIDSPRSQAVSGFLAKAGPVKLGTVTIASPLEYGTVWVISLDGLPLATSKRILVQAFSDEKLFGAKSENGRVIDTGKAPINVRDLAGTVTLPGALAGSVLDGHGYPTGPAAVASADGSTTLTLARDAIYTVLTR